MKNHLKLLSWLVLYIIIWYIVIRVTFSIQAKNKIIDFYEQKYNDPQLTETIKRLVMSNQFQIAEWDLPCKDSNYYYRICFGEVEKVSIDSL